MAKYSNPAGQWLVVCVCLLVLGLGVGYGYGHQGITDNGKVITPVPLKTEELPVNFVIRPIPAYVYDYLGNAYAARDKNVIILVATWDDWCYGVVCEQWVIKPHFTHPPIMLRCYPDFDNQCAPTYEAEYIVPPPGQAPTPTNYSDKSGKDS